MFCVLIYAGAMKVAVMLMVVVMLLISRGFTMWGRHVQWTVISSHPPRRHRHDHHHHYHVINRHSDVISHKHGIVGV